jgi:pimeloyl-ACP methyl ester carboxylesterase
MRVLYVVDPADAAKIHWTPCESANDYWPHWTGNILPSIQALDFAPDALSKVTIPVLIVHGRRDRQSPYGGGREWASRLPNARLVTVEHAAHVPWIEAGTRVFGAIERFLDGAWPEEAETVEAVADLAEGGRV